MGIGEGRFRAAGTRPRRPDPCRCRPGTDPLVGQGRVSRRPLQGRGPGAHDDDEHHHDDGGTAINHNHDHLEHDDDFDARLADIHQRANDIGRHVDAAAVLNSLGAHVQRAAASLHHAAGDLDEFRAVVADIHRLAGAYLADTATVCTR